ncbi:hypothetical protein JOL62DRAFT_371579 [Phyllosticta paracitricarpa]|uniref:Uncharacterized protein n=1 Tax=Phyllosticta paracitricarpa TaxID=2016321 RepID=A0ABR1MT51_9PEZI
MKTKAWMRWKRTKCVGQLSCGVLQQRYPCPAAFVSPSCCPADSPSLPQLASVTARLTSPSPRLFALPSDVLTRSIRRHLVISLSVPLRLAGPPMHDCAIGLKRPKMPWSANSRCNSGHVQQRISPSRPWQGAAGTNVSIYPLVSSCNNSLRHWTNRPPSRVVLRLSFQPRQSFLQM